MMVMPAKLNSTYFKFLALKKYILNKLKRFSVPVVASRIKNDSQEFEGLSIIRVMITHLSVLYNDSLRKKEE
jgi:hypothetical protein